LPGASVVGEEHQQRQNEIHKTAHVILPMGWPLVKNTNSRNMTDLFGAM
jgi:hypothetical protein